MSEQKREKVKYIKNNIYAVKLLWSISHKRVIHIALKQLTRYFEWLFYQIFFLKYIVSGLEKGYEFNEIFKLMMIFFGIFTALALYNSYVKGYVVPKTDIIIDRKLYRKLYEKAANVELRCYEDSEFYSKYTMAIDGSSQRIIQAVDSFFNIIFGIIASIVAFAVIINIDIYAGLFVLFPIIGNFVFGRLMNKIHYGRYVDNIKNERIRQYVTRVMYLGEYAKEIRFSNIHELLMYKYDKSVENTEKVMDKYGNQGATYMGLKNIFSFPLVFEGTMLYAAYSVIVKQTMGLADLAIIFSTMSTTSWILIGLFNTITESLKNGLQVQYMRDFIDYKEKIPEDQDGIIPDREIKTIEFRNVYFEYQKDIPLIQNVSFKIDKNTSVALVGHNGAGKSTLIKLLLRLYDPTKGEIFVNGINIKRYNLKEYRKLFSAAFQDYKIMATSVRENLCMGRKIKDELLKESLEKAGINSKINNMPKGMDTQLTKEFDPEGVMLSGGETQKIIIAREFAKQAPIQIFDEPSSALDPIAEYELYTSIMQGCKNSIMIFISHRLSSVKGADYVYMLENGQIIESGTHNELMKSDEKYSEMYTKQANSYLAIDNT